MSVLASLDVGTSTIRCFLVDKSGVVRGKSKANVVLHYPNPGYVEISCDELWHTCLDVINRAVRDSGLGFESIVGFGISCQRNSFTIWNKITKRPYYNFITWKDIRADNIVKDTNSSLKWKAFRFVSRVAYTFTRSKRFLAGSIFRLTNNQVTPRLLWLLKNCPSISEGLLTNDVAFGTIDTWLLYKLSDGLLHVTDISNASSTGLFDPFTLCWSDWLFKMLNIPKKMFPEVVDSAGTHFGFISKKIFSSSIPIYCSISDQSASLFGSCCFNSGDIKITLGTGTFLDVNTGSKPHASFHGIYPLVGWKIENELVFAAEGSSNDTGGLIKWALDMDLLNNPEESASFAESVEGNDGVYFIPAFNGFEAPVNDTQAAAGFIGLKPTTKKAHLLRAILESIVFRIVQLFTVFIDETNIKPSFIRVDGGVSCNDFILQMVADIINVPIYRPSSTEVSAMGAAYMVGLIAGFWKSKDQLRDLNKLENEFLPQKSTSLDKVKEYQNWCKAIRRFSQWYSDVS